MIQNQKIVIMTISLMYYQEKVIIGITELYTGKKRKQIRDSLVAGKQITDVFAYVQQVDLPVVIVLDDKFTHERSRGVVLSTTASCDFLHHESVRIIDYFASIRHRIVSPPASLAIGEIFFSEEKLLQFARPVHGLASDCANEWMYLLEYLYREGYREFEAYIPRVCFPGVCYATPLLQADSCPVPIRITFTTNKSVGSESYLWTNGDAVLVTC